MCGDLVHSLHCGFFPELQFTAPPAVYCRICLQRRRPGFRPWVRKVLWRREWQSTPVFSPRESHGREAWWASSWRRKESDTTEWLTHPPHENTGVAHLDSPWVQGSEGLPREWLPLTPRCLGMKETAFCSVLRGAPSLGVSAVVTHTACILFSKFASFIFHS